MSGKLTLLFVAPTAYPLGGVAVWLSYLLPALNSLGWRVVFGAVDGRFHRADEYLARYAFPEVVRIPNPSATPAGRMRAIAKAIRQVDADIVLSVNIPDVFEAVKLVKRKANPRLKAVMTLHGLEPDYFAEIKHCSNDIDAVVVTNRLTQKMVIDFTGYPSDRVYYAPYGVQIEPQRQLEVVENRQSPRLTILYAGRIDDQQKRCSDLVGIVAGLERSGKDYQLILAGDGDRRIDLLRQLERISSEKCVKYLGNLSQTELFGIAYNSADVLILTSEWETGPIVVWEAMAHGLAVVTARYLGYATEAALRNQQNCLMFDVGDTATAVQCVIELYDSQLRQSLIKEGYALIEQRYTHEQSIASWSKQLQAISDQVASPTRAVVKTKLVEKKPNKHGRLEKLFGVSGGGLLRKLLNRSEFVAGPGSEWPHALNALTENEVRQFSLTLNAVERNVKEF